jgi:hypothetical protein
MFFYLVVWCFQGEVGRSRVRCREHGGGDYWNKNFIIAADKAHATHLDTFFPQTFFTPPSGLKCPKNA